MKRLDALVADAVLIAICLVIFFKKTARYWHKVDCADTSGKNLNKSATILSMKLWHCPETIF
jgi:hypothetical protein